MNGSPTATFAGAEGSAAATLVPDRGGQGPSQTIVDPDLDFTGGDDPIPHQGIETAIKAAGSLGRPILGASAHRFRRPDGLRSRLGWGRPRRNRPGRKRRSRNRPPTGGRRQGFRGGALGRGHRHWRLQRGRRNDRVWLGLHQRDAGQGQQPQGGQGQQQMGRPGSHGAGGDSNPYEAGPI